MFLISNKSDFFFCVCAFGKDYKANKGTAQPLVQDTLFDQVSLNRIEDSSCRLYGNRRI